MGELYLLLAMGGSRNIRWDVGDIVSEGVVPLTSRDSELWGFAPKKL